MRGRISPLLWPAALAFGLLLGGEVFAAPPPQQLDQLLSRGIVQDSEASAPDDIVTSPALTRAIAEVDTKTRLTGREQGVCIRRAGEAAANDRLFSLTLKLVSLPPGAAEAAALREQMAALQAGKSRNPVLEFQEVVPGDEMSVSFDCADPFIVGDLHTHPQDGSFQPSSMDFAYWGHAPSGETAFMVSAPFQNAGLLVLETIQSRAMHDNSPVHEKLVALLAYAVASAVPTPRGSAIAQEKLATALACSALKLACYLRLPGDPHYLKMTVAGIDTELLRSLAPSTVQMVRWEIQAMTNWLITSPSRHHTAPPGDDRSAGTLSFTELAEDVLKAATVIGAYSDRGSAVATPQARLGHRLQALLRTPDRQILSFTKTRLSRWEPDGIGTFDIGTLVSIDGALGCVRIGTSLQEDGSTSVGDAELVDWSEGNFGTNCLYRSQQGKFDQFDVKERIHNGNLISEKTDAHQSGAPLGAAPETRQAALADLWKVEETKAHAVARQAKLVIFELP